LATAASSLGLLSDVLDTSRLCTSEIELLKPNAQKKTRAQWMRLRGFLGAVATPL
jgi:hypothetical protein